VAIARALANDPLLVLADEPTGNLDDQSAQSIMRLLTSAVRERGRTLLLVTHERDATQAADVSFKLEAGEFDAGMKRSKRIAHHYAAQRNARVTTVYQSSVPSCGSSP
jgi:ABC-type lipoprotein export system ATPase subunit